MQSKILHKFRCNSQIDYSRLCTNKWHMFNFKLSNSKHWESCRFFELCNSKHCNKFRISQTVTHRNENTNEKCNCTMHYSAVLQELNSKSHLKCLSKCSNRKEQTCRINKLTNRLMLKRIFLKEHVRHCADIKRHKGLTCAKTLLS